MEIKIDDQKRIRVLKVEDGGEIGLEGAELSSADFSMEC